MSCTQNGLSPTLRLRSPTMRLSRTCSFSEFSFVRASALCTPTQMLQHHKIPSLVCSSSKTKTSGPICLFGGKGNSRGENKSFSWDSLKGAIEGLRQKKIGQDNLRDQMRQREFSGGDGDGNPPWSRGVGGSDGTEDEGFAGALDEALQVFLATIALIVVYIYIIRGAELFKLARDYVKYLVGGVPSTRLQRVMDKWRKRWSEFSYAEREESLEHLIVTTPTWWNRPEETARAVKSKRGGDQQEN